MLLQVAVVAVVAGVVAAAKWAKVQKLLKELLPLVFESSSAVQSKVLIGLGLDLGLVQPPYQRPHWAEHQKRASKLRA